MPPIFTSIYKGESGFSWPLSFKRPVHKDWPRRSCVNSVSYNILQALHFTTTFIEISKDETIKNGYWNSWQFTPVFIVYVRLSSSLAKMLFYFQNLKHFILFLISSLPRYIKSSDNYSDLFPLVVNTWAGNHEVATDKGNKTTADHTIDLRSRNYS